MSQRLTSQRETLLNSYTKRLKDDIKSILDNFTEILKSAKVEEETQVARLTQAVEDQYEIEVRACNIVRAGESLMKLVSDMKEFLILNDFPSVNQSIKDRIEKLRAVEQETDNKVLEIREALAADLIKLEDEYYSSRFK